MSKILGEFDRRIFVHEAPRFKLYRKKKIEEENIKKALQMALARQYKCFLVNPLTIMSLVMYCIECGANEW